ncbi:winged helix-turn-helix domain-containing protein [Saccharopolyspora sp. SCSIO 74807]|uniref:AfsR/SARP family transcriptional regulator n=1 Tax=Saccharopolyspora sp. SCSIO 74807 TaxID=3118084 RepID=UPI0030CAA372
MELEFFVLGPLEVRSAGVEIPVRSGQQRVLLAALLLRANQVVPLDELTDRLWGEAPPRGARNTLRAYVMRLRRTLGADDGDGVVVETHPEGYRIRVEPAELDLLRFEDLLAQAGRLAAAGPMEEAQVLRQAVALWRGPVLSNVDSDGCIGTPSWR